jgi:hypothetical protein
MTYPQIAQMAQRYPSTPLPAGFDFLTISDKIDIVIFLGGLVFTRREIRGGSTNA